MVIVPVTPVHANDGVNNDVDVLTISSASECVLSVGRCDGRNEMKKKQKLQVDTKCDILPVCSARLVIAILWNLWARVGRSNQQAGGTLLRYARIIISVTSDVHSRLRNYKLYNFWFINCPWRHSLTEKPDRIQAIVRVESQIFFFCLNFMKRNKRQSFFRQFH